MTRHYTGNRLIAGFLTSAAILTLTVSISAQGQGRGRGGAAPPAPAAPPVADPRDLQSVWQGNMRVDTTPKMLPVAQKRFDDNTEELRRKVPITKDPTFRCDPAGVPHVYNNGVHPFEILQTPSRTFLFYEAARMWRTVWTDGRSIPDDVDDLWLGYSVGRWEGNELVVDTAGFNDTTWIDAGGHPHSTKLHVTERFRRVDRDTLQIKLTLTDPEYYDGPWSLTGTYRRQPKWEVEESFCIPDEQQIFDQTVLKPNARPASP